MHRNHIPTSTGDDAHKNYMRAALLADAVVHSDYWQRVLGGPALCVLDDDGRIAFRLSTNKHDDSLMFKRDAVIQLTAEGPKAYSTVTHKTLQGAHRVDPFHFAASLATQLEWLSSKDWFIDSFVEAIYYHEEALERSVQMWIKNGNHDQLCGLKEILMNTGPAATQARAQ